MVFRGLNNWIKEKDIEITEWKKTFCTVPDQNPTAESLECGKELWKVQGELDCLQTSAPAVSPH